MTNKQLTTCETALSLTISSLFVTEKGQRPETRITKPVLCGIVLSAERALSQVVSCSFINYDESTNGPVYSFQILITIIIIILIIIIIIIINK